MVGDFWGARVLSVALAAVTDVVVKQRKSTFLGILEAAGECSRRRRDRLFPPPLRQRLEHRAFRWRQVYAGGYRSNPAGGERCLTMVGSAGRTRIPAFLRAVQALSKAPVRTPDSGFRTQVRDELVSKGSQLQA